MNAVAAHLAAGLNVRCGVTVGGVERGAAGWRVRSAASDVLAEARTLAVTAPAPQAAALLAAAPELARTVRPVVMEPCWAVMLGFAAPVAVAFDAAFVNSGPLSWVARNSSKPGRDGGEAWVLHAAPTWSGEHLEREADEVRELLTAEFAQRCVGGALPEVAHADAHRWRFAQPEPALAAPCLFDDGLGIGVAGDWCGGPRVEGAFLSGLALARRILGGAPP
jgi:predicted NAD/FAD-dependent oxidoreductase